MKTRTFSVDVDNKKVELMIKSPSLEDQREASKTYNNVFSEALKAKAVVRAKLDDLLLEQGLWDDSKQNRFNNLQSQILEGEKKLAKGGISLNEAKAVALDMKKTRDDLRDLISVKTSLDTHTAEGQADNARFNYLVSACTVYKDTNRRYFNTYEEYLSKSTDPVAIAAAQNLASMLYGLDSDYEDKLPENKFLKQYKFIDSKLRLIDKQGRLVDRDGRLIDENGRFINEKGEFVDKNGNLVDAEGEYIVEFSPFLDDDGKPVPVPQDAVKNETTDATTTKEVDEKSSSSTPAPSAEPEKIESK